MVNQGSILKSSINTIFSLRSLDNKVSLDGFQFLLDDLSNLPDSVQSLLSSSSSLSSSPSLPSSSSELPSSTRENKNSVQLNPSTTKQKSKNTDLVTSEEISPTDNDEFEEISVEKSFAELSGKRKIVTFESLVAWDVVAELLLNGSLNKEVGNRDAIF